MELDGQEFEVGLRNKEILKLMKLSYFLLAKFDSTAVVDGKLNLKEINLDLSNKVSEALVKVFTYLRKTSDPNVVAKIKAPDHQIITFSTDVQISIQKVAEDFIALEGYEPFDFKIATSMMDLLTSFKLVYNEVRVGGNIFKLKCGKTCDIRAYGLNHKHLPFLYGITFKPERRGAMINDLGILALCILLLHEDKYPAKIENALKSSGQMLPMIDCLISYLRTARSWTTFGCLFRVLGDYLLILTKPKPSRINFPLIFFMYIVEKESKDLSVINFSGLKGFATYNRHATALPWSKKSSASAELVRQIIFHTMFETATKDLGILGSITDCKEWNQRSQLGSVFTKESIQEKIMLTPIMFEYVSKPDKVNLPKPAGTGMLYSMPIFAGRRIRHFSAEAKAYFFGSSDPPIHFGSDAMSLIHAMAQYTDRAKQSIEQDVNKGAIKTDWYTFGPNSELILSAEKTFRGTDEFFYS